MPIIGTPCVLDSHTCSYLSQNATAFLDTPYAGTASASIGGAPGRRGPAQTTSSAGQLEQANSLGVGTKRPALIAAIASVSPASSAGTSARRKTVETTSSARSRKQ